MHSLKQTTAYTLVELIVVIAILIILSTVGFVGYSQYTITSRDGARASDLKALYAGLKIVQAQKGKAPNPDNGLTINNSSWAHHALQGVVGESVRTLMNLESGGRDPQSGKPYTYLLYQDKKHFQLLGMFEQDGFQTRFAWDAPLLPSAYAENLDFSPVTIGTKLWVLLDTATETPINEVLTGSVSLTSLAASGATIVGSPIVGTGSSVVMTPNMVVALSNPLTTTGGLIAAIIPLPDQLYGSGSTYVALWGSTTCVPANITVVEVNEANFLTIFPGARAWRSSLLIPVNTIYNFAAGNYKLDIGSAIVLNTCSALVGAWKGITTITYENFNGAWVSGMWNLQINGIYSIIKNVTFAINGPGANGIAVFSGSNDVLDSVELLYQSGLTSTVLGSIKYMNNTTVNGVVIDN